MNNAKKSRVARNRRAVVVGAFFLLSPVVFYSFSHTAKGSLDARVSSVEEALGRYLENRIGMDRRPNPEVIFESALRADSKIRSQDRGRRGDRPVRREEGEYIVVFNRRATQQVGMDRLTNPEVIFESALRSLPRGSILRSRWQVLASVAYNVSRQNEDCDPAIGGDGERASCLLKRGCLERAGVLYNGLIGGKAGIYVKRLIEKLSRNHKIRCRSEINDFPEVVKLNFPGI